MPVDGWEVEKARPRTQATLSETEAETTTTVQGQRDTSNHPAQRAPSWALIERASTTYQGRAAMAATQRKIRGTGRVDFAAPPRPEHQRVDTPEHQRADAMSWMVPKLHSPPRHHGEHDAVKRRSGPGVDAQEATREYLRMLAAERARRRKERQPGYELPTSPDGQASGEHEKDTFDARSAAAAQAYEQEVREKRESKLMWNTARVWVDIIVEQAAFESERRARAAARLQARVRGDQQRSDTRRMRCAIIKVQAAARARQARSVLSMLQGSRARKERELAERNLQREQNRERSAEQRLLRLQDEASIRAQAGHQARTLKQSRALAEDLICMACDNDVGPLAQLLRETPRIEHVVNLTDGGGWTPLMWGASLGHVQICSLLLHASASVHPRDGDGWDALMLATDRSHVESAEILLNSNADPALEAKYGRSSLSLARAQGSRGKAMLALLQRPPSDQQQHRPSSAPATPAMQRSRKDTKVGARPSTAGGYGCTNADKRAISPTRIVQRGQRPSTAARELQQAIEQMNDVGMHVIGSAGFSTIIQARHLGIDTVIEAMLAYAEHHGVQHFGVAALAEQHENVQGSLQPSNTLFSALVQASAAHPSRQLDVVLPAMSLLAQTFLGPLAIASFNNTPAAPATDSTSDANDAEVLLQESLGEAIAAAMCVGSTAVALRVMLMHDISAGGAVDDLDDVPHTHIEDLLEMILLGLRCSAAGKNGPARDCFPTLVESGLVQPMVTIVHVYGRSGRDKMDLVRMAAAALCLLAAPQPRYSCEVGSSLIPKVMPTLRRQRQLTLICAEGLRFCIEGPRGSGSAMNPYAVVWWEGERLGRTEVVLASEAPAWGTTLQFTLPPQGQTATLRVEIYSEANPIAEGSDTAARLADRLVGGVTLQLGGDGDPGSTDVILPPFVAQLSASVTPGSTTQSLSTSKSRRRPQSAKNKNTAPGVMPGHVMLSIDEQVGGFKLAELVKPSSANFVLALAKADGLRTLVHACTEAQSTAVLRVLPNDVVGPEGPKRDDVEAEQLETKEQDQLENEEPVAEHEAAAERAADAQLVLDVLRTGASTALAGRSDGTTVVDATQLAVADADTTSGDVSALVEELLVESGLIALARDALLPPPDPDAAAERSAGRGKLSDALLATLALRASVCLAAVLEARPGMDISFAKSSSLLIDADPAGALDHCDPEEQQQQAGESKDAAVTASLVLDAALAHADVAAEYCNPVLDAVWLLLRRIGDNVGGDIGATGMACAAKATISKIAWPRPVRTGAMSVAAGEIQARALHSVHWLWCGIDTGANPDDNCSTPAGTGWGWMSEEQLGHLVTPVLKLLEGSSGDGGGTSTGVVGEQQDEACRLTSLLLQKGPLFLKSMLLETIGSGGGMLRLRELMDDGTPAMSWSKAYSAAALQAAQRLCAPTSRLPAQQQLQLAMPSASVGGLGRSGVAMMSNFGNAAVNFIERKTGLDIDGDGDVGLGPTDRDELLRRQQPVLTGLKVARRAGLLMELQPTAIGAALFPSAPRPQEDQRSDRQVATQERHDGQEEASVLALVLSPTTDVARLDRKLLDCMVEMAYWRRMGEDVLAPNCVLGVLGLDGRGVGSRGSQELAGITSTGKATVASPVYRPSASLRMSWKALGLSAEELPALVLIKQRAVIERQAFGQVDSRGGMCARGGEAAISTALPPLSKDALQHAVELMLRAAH